MESMPYDLPGLCCPVRIVFWTQVAKCLFNHYCQDLTWWWQRCFPILCLKSDCLDEQIFKNRNQIIKIISLTGRASKFCEFSWSCSCILNIVIYSAVYFLHMKEKMEISF